jgi:hypothetical protein
MSDTNLIQLASRISSLYNQRILDPHKELLNKMRSAAPKDIKTSPKTPLNLPQDWLSYMSDSFQRSVLFWDTIGQGGDDFIEHERAGKPPVLIYGHETIVGEKWIEFVCGFLARPLRKSEIECVDISRINWTEVSIKEA